MGRRLELQALLKGITDNVYFQPPANKQMQYPCILYMRDAEDRKFADNVPYFRTKNYQVTVIDRDPDSLIPDEIGALPLCRFTQHFISDELHHDVFSLYF